MKLRLAKYLLASLLLTVVVGCSREVDRRLEPELKFLLAEGKSSFFAGVGKRLQKKIDRRRSNSGKCVARRCYCR